MEDECPNTNTEPKLDKMPGSEHRALHVQRNQAGERAYGPCELETARLHKDKTIGVSEICHQNKPNRNDRTLTSSP